MKPDDHVIERLDAWRTGELEPAERERVEAHLAGCPRCREELAALESWTEAFERGLAARRWAAAGLEPDWAAQRAAIVARTSGRARGAGGRWAFWRWAPQAALVAVAAIVIGVVWREAGEEAVPEPPALEAPAGTRAEAPSATSRRRDAASEDAAGRAAAEGLEARDQAAPEREALEKAVAKDELGRQAEPAGQEAALADRIAPAELRNLAPERDRFERAARAALAERDTLAARRALALWADTLEPLVDADVIGRGSALADSLEAMLAAE